VKKGEPKGMRRQRTVVFAGHPSFPCRPRLPPSDTSLPEDRLPVRRAGPGGGAAVRNEFNVLALIKGNEHYVYVYDDQSRKPLLETSQAHAKAPTLSLNGFDAAIPTEKAAEQALAGGEHPPRF